MKKIGLLSDTHGYIDDGILFHLRGCDEIWHAGDVGDPKVITTLESLEKPLRGVYGNIDSKEVRLRFPLEQFFEIEGCKVYMIHIGAAPPKFTPSIRKKLMEVKPLIFVCGHSHILKVAKDAALNVLYMNPGAAGVHGFHHIRTLLLFDIDQGIPTNLRVVELGARGTIINSQKNS